MAELSTLMSYQGWATARVLAALAPLTAEELARDLHSSHGGVAGTLAHLYGSDLIWAARLRGDAPPSFTALPPLPALDELAGRWAAVYREQHTLLTAGPEDERVAYATLRGEPQRSTLGQIGRHLINHATYHRGQIVTMLRQLGHPAPNTDLIAFYRLQGASGPDGLA